MADIIQTKEVLKSYFETGDKPDQYQYAFLIDALRHVEDKIPLADLSLEGYDEEGSKDNHLHVRLGDFFDASNGTKMVIDDPNAEITFKGKIKSEDDIEAIGRTITAGSFIGDGSLLTNVATEIPANVAYTDTDNNFIAAQTIANSAPTFNLQDVNAANSSEISGFLHYKDSSNTSGAHIGMANGNLELWARNGDIKLTKRTLFDGSAEFNEDAFFFGETEFERTKFNGEIDASNQEIASQVINLKGSNNGLWMFDRVNTANSFRLVSSSGILNLTGRNDNPFEETIFLSFNQNMDYTTLGTDTTVTGRLTIANRTDINSPSFASHLRLTRLENSFNNTWDITLAGGGSKNNLTFTAENAEGYDFSTRIHFSADKNVYPQQDNDWDIGTNTNRFKDIHAVHFIGDGSQLTNVSAAMPSNVAYTDEDNEFSTGQTVLGNITIGSNNGANGDTMVSMFSGERLSTNGTTTLFQRAAFSGGSSWGQSTISTTAPSNGDGLLTISTSESNSLVEKIIIDENVVLSPTSGSVGIGILNPPSAYKLDVHGSTNGMARIYGPNIARLSLQNSTRHYSTSVQGGGWLFFDETGGAARYLITSTGDHNFQSGTATFGGDAFIKKNEASLVLSKSDNDQYLKLVGGSGANSDIIAQRTLTLQALSGDVQLESANSISFDTNSAVRYQIDTSGNHDFKTGTATFGGGVSIFNSDLTLTDGTRTLSIEENGGASHRIHGSGYLLIDADSVVQLQKDGGEVSIGDSAQIRLFGNGNATFGGALNLQNDLNITSSYPRIRLTDTENEDWSLINNNGEFIIHDDTNSAVLTKWINNTKELRHTGFINIETSTANSDVAKLVLTNTDLSIINEQELSSIEFYNSDADGGHTSAFIKNIAAESYGRKGQLVFGVSKTNSTDAEEVARFDELGNFTTSGVMNANAGIDVSNQDNQTTVTPLGTSTGSVAKFRNLGDYGMNVFVSSSGSTYLQSQRFDGDTSTYDMYFQYLGGKVIIGDELDVTGTANFNDKINIGGDIEFESSQLLGWKYNSPSNNTITHSISGGLINPMAFKVASFSAPDPIFTWEGDSRIEMTLYNGGRLDIEGLLNANAGINAFSQTINAQTLRATNQTDEVALQYFGLEFNRSLNYLRPTSGSVKDLRIGGANHGDFDWGTVYVYTTGTDDFRWNNNTVATQDWTVSEVADKTGLTDGIATNPTYSGDFYTLGDSKFYRTGSGSSNIPSGSTTNGYLLNLTRNGNYKSRLFINDTNDFYTSVLANGVESGWKKIATQEYVDAQVGGSSSLQEVTDNGSTTTNSITAADFRLNALNSAPNSKIDTGTVGEIRFTADHIYVCVANNTWKRVALVDDMILPH